MPNLTSNNTTCFKPVKQLFKLEILVLTFYLIFEIFHLISFELFFRLQFIVLFKENGHIVEFMNLSSISLSF